MHLVDMHAVTVVSVKAVFHCSRFARAGGATDFNLVKSSRAGTPRKLNVVQLPSVSARTTEADRKRSD